MGIFKRSTLGAIVIISILLVASGVERLVTLGTPLLWIFGAIFLIFVVMSLLRNIRAF